MASIGQQTLRHVHWMMFHPICQQIANRVLYKVQYSCMGDDLVGRYHKPGPKVH